jgi:hypothetical protein
MTGGIGELMNFSLLAHYFDFQKLCDDAFQLMRGKYFRPADLIAEMRLRKRLRIKMPRPRKPNTRAG